MADVIVIGGGVIGCAVARELTRYRCDVLLLEKNSDICEGTSKANSGIVHAGFDCKPGTLKAKFNLLGNRMMGQIAKELDVPYKQNGSLVVCMDEAERYKLQDLYDRGVKNGVTDLRIIDREELRALEPNISDRAVAALLAPAGGIICPYSLTIAYAENAVTNGAVILRDHEVTDIEKTENGYKVKCGAEVFEARMVINAGGCHAGEIHGMVSAEKVEIIPRRGEYMLLDRKTEGFVSHTIFGLPGEKGKGILVTPTTHGNTLAGPTAEDQQDLDNVDTTGQGLKKVSDSAYEMVNNFPGRSVITSFAGLRAHRPEGDFLIGEPADAEYFVDAAGIESPGLSSAPAIAKYIAEYAKERMALEVNPEFNPERKAIRPFAEADTEERAALIKENPLYGKIICRCETVTEAEIVEAIHRPCGAVSVDGIKRRTRAGMGRCQAGFCLPKTIEILARELGCSADEITKHGAGSAYISPDDGGNYDRT